MRLGILGGGFGLYGYLPALFKAGDFTVLLPATYQAKFKQRNDISHFFNRIEWVDNDDDLLAACEAVIIALPPKQQVIRVKNCLAYNAIRHILLEKPVATTPILATDLMRHLESSGKKFGIGYNFRYTDWGKTILNNALSIEHITWNFQAHHYANNTKTWKRHYLEGGGALRFYGIHLIAFLAELGYSDVFYSEIKAAKANEAEIWNATLVGAGLLPCRLSINSNHKDTQFIIKDYSGNHYLLIHPFQTLQPLADDNGLDHRIPFLIDIIKDLFFNEKIDYEVYRKTNLLWNKIEQRTLW